MDPITALAAMNGVATTMQQYMNNPSEQQQQYNLQLMDRQYQLNQMGADAQMRRELEIYNQTGPASKVEQLKQAGLNPALIYSMGAGGAGGVTGNITAPNVGLPSAPNVAQAQGNKIAAEGMMLQLAKLQSEIKVNESVAAANNANAAITSGAQTERTSAETQLTQSKTLGQNIQNNFDSINLEIAQNTKDVNIQKIVALADQAKVEMNRSIQGLIQDKTKSAEDVATLQSKIDQYNANVQKTVAETINKNVDTEEKRQAITESIARISQNWTSKIIDVQQLQVELKKTLMNNNTTIDATVISSLSHILSGMMPKF